MKRSLGRFLLLLSFLLLAGCQSGQDAVFVDPNAVQSGNYGTLSFAANGVTFGIFDEADAVMQALPEPNNHFVGESCAFGGNDNYYFYNGFELMCNEMDGVFRITNIRIADDTVTTPQGFSIGMTEEAAEALLPSVGAEQQTRNALGGYTFVSGTTELVVLITDGVVTDIHYTPAVQP